MYLITNDTRYPCTGAPSLYGDTLTFVLPEGGPEALGSTVDLYMEDDFHMVSLDVSGYLRWAMEEDILTITNLPEAEPLPDPPPPEPGPAPLPQVSTDDLAAAVLDLMFEVDLMKLKGGNAK